MNASDTLSHSMSVLLWMILPVVAGYLFWRFWLKMRPDGERIATACARGFSLTAILLVVSPMMIILFWKADLPVGHAVLLPFAGLFSHVFGGLLGFAFGRISGLSRSEQGAAFLGGTSSNILSFGGITLVFLLATNEDPSAERALRQMAIFRILESPYYFLVAWPLASLIAKPPGEASGRWLEVFKQAFRPVTMIPVLGILAGLGLNALGIARPGVLDGVAADLACASITLLGLMVGLTLPAARPIRHFRSCLIVSAIKFSLVPCATVAVAWLVGFHGPTLQVVAICTSMPVAFMALVGANLYGLEKELVSSLWLFTTAAMVVVVPILTILVPALAGF